MFGWLKKGSKSVVDNGKQLIGTESLIETGKEVKSAAKIILSPKEKIKNARKETFKEAMLRQGINEIDLAQIYKNYSQIVYISIVMFIFLLGFVFYSLFFKQQIITSISGLVFCAFCLVNAFKYSFRSFQIKHQKLCSVKEWYDRPNEWIPK